MHQPLHPVDVVDRDRAAAAEEDDEDGEADRGFGGGDGEHEHRQHLAGQIAEIGREGDEVDVHREQDQLDRHQHQDDVAAVEEDAEHADREQDRGDGQIMARGRSQLHPLAHARLECCNRLARTAAICLRDLLRRVSRRLRWVSTIAPIIATSRIRPAISNANR